jgi:predicted dehydrogenase
MTRRGRIIHLIALAAVIAFGSAAAHAQDAAGRRQLKAGIIGLDTSHVIAFTNVINAAKDPAKDGDLGYLTVVAGYPGGSPDVASSATRVEGYTQKLHDMGVEIVDSVPALVTKVDVVLLESVDGRPHLEQAMPVIKAGKRLFIDKPMAGSLADVIAIFELAKRHKVPVFSSSSLRYMPGLMEARRGEDPTGKVFGCTAWGPCSLEPHHPDLFWYGVHGCETLYTVMGTGCQSVTRVHADGTDVVMGTWEGGRVGVFRGLRAGKEGYGALIFGAKAITQVDRYGGYKPLVEKIATFFQTGEPPVAADETIELFAFMEAADVSKRLDGAPVKLADVLARARVEAMKKIGNE